MVPPIVGYIIDSLAGVLLNNGREVLASWLRDGDIIDERFRRMIMNNLNIVDEKLDGYARTLLHTSIHFVADGMNLLCESRNTDARDGRSESSESQSGTQDYHGEWRSGMLKEVLKLSLENLNSVSKSNLKTAKQRFEHALVTTTLAFHAESLDIKDRIVAAKVRLASDVLKNLEEPDTAISVCYLMVETLNREPKIRANFSLFACKDRKWTLGTEAQRQEVTEIVKSVMLINIFLFHFVFHLGDIKRYSALEWSTIKLSDFNVNPIIGLHGVLKGNNPGEELIQLPNELNLDEQTDLHCAVVNSRCDIIAVDDDGIKVIFRTGESETVQLNDPNREDAERGVFDQRTTSLAVGKDDNVYVLRLHKKHGKKIDENVLVLYVLDKEYTVKIVKRLNFLPKLALFSTGSVRLAVNENNQIFMIVDSSECAELVYVFSSTGEYLEKFEWEHFAALRSFLCVFVNNEIILAACDEVCLKVYQDQNDSSIEIKLPANHMVCGIVYHFALSKIVMLTYVEKDESYFLYCFNKETGELKTSMFFCKKSDSGCSPMITSHPAGPVAIIREGSITYL
jgi:hypothetical protein